MPKIEKGNLQVKPPFLNIEVFFFGIKINKTTFSTWKVFALGENSTRKLFQHGRRFLSKARQVKDSLLKWGTLVK